MEGGKKQNTGKRTERTTLEDEEPFAICYDNFGSYPSSLRLRSRVHPATQRSQDGRGIRKQLWVSFEELKTDLQNMPLVVLCEKYCLDKSQAGLRDTIVDALSAEMSAETVDELLARSANISLSAYFAQQPSRLYSCFTRNERQGLMDDFRDESIRQGCIDTCLPDNSTDGLKPFLQNLPIQTRTSMLDLLALLGSSFTLNKEQRGLPTDISSGATFWLRQLLEGLFERVAFSPRAAQLQSQASEEFRSLFALGKRKAFGALHSASPIRSHTPSPRYQGGKRQKYSSEESEKEENEQPQQGDAWEDDEEDPLLVSDEVGQADSSVEVQAADSANPQAIEANKLSGTVHSHYSIRNEEVVTEAKDLAEECKETQTPEKPEEPQPEEQLLNAMVEDNSGHVSGRDEGNEEEQQEEEEEQGAKKVSSKIEKTQDRERGSEKDDRHRQHERERERHGDGREAERRWERVRERERRSTHEERPFPRNKFVNHRREEIQVQGEWGRQVWDRRVNPMGKGPHVTLYQQSGFPLQGHRQHGFVQNRMGFNPQGRNQGSRYHQSHEEHRERERERRRKRENQRDEMRKGTTSKEFERERERKRRDREQREGNQKNDRAREEAMEKERQLERRKHREQELQRARERERETGRDRPSGKSREEYSVDSETRPVPQNDLEKDASPSQGLGNEEALAQVVLNCGQRERGSRTAGGIAWADDETPNERWIRDRPCGPNESEDRQEQEGEIVLDIPPLYTEMELRCMTSLMLGELMTKHGFTPRGKEECIQALLAFSEAVQGFDAKRLEQTIEEVCMTDVGHKISGHQTLSEWDRLVGLAQTGRPIDDCLTDEHVSLFLEGIITQLPARNFAIVSSIQSAIENPFNNSYFCERWDSNFNYLYAAVHNPGHFTGLFFEIDRGSGILTVIVCDSMIKHGARLPSPTEHKVIDKLRAFLSLSTKRCVNVTLFVSPSYATALEPTIPHPVHSPAYHYVPSYRVRLLPQLCLPQQTDLTSCGYYAGLIFPLLFSRAASSPCISGFISLLKCVFSSDQQATAMPLTQARDLLSNLSTLRPKEVLEALQKLISQ